MPSDAKCSTTFGDTSKKFQRYSQRYEHYCFDFPSFTMKEPVSINFDTGDLYLPKIYSMFNHPPNVSFKGMSGDKSFDEQ